MNNRMDVATRIKFTIGDLLVQVATLSARIEELEDQIQAQQQNDSAKVKANGGDIVIDAQSN